jgi:transcriptional regulator with XRE-family HTH domain
MTQQYVAEKTGIASQTVSKIENRNWSFGFDLLENYASVFGMKIDVS